MSDEPSARRTRATYDTVAGSYADIVPALEHDHPMHRAVLDVFAELVGAAGGGPVVDVGCGTGRVTAYLDSLGLDVSGIDLSPGMLAIARRDHPGLRFSEGSLLDLDLPAAGVAGLVAWYSIIHLPPDKLPSAFAEFRRVLRPEGYLQLGFHLGDQHSHKTQGYGHDGISLDVYRLPVERVSTLLAEAGFAVHTTVVQQPHSDIARAPGACLLARLPEAA